MLLDFVLILSTIILNMSTKPTPLYLLFGSKTRADLIALVTMHPGESFYIRQLATLLKQSPTPVIRELEKLEKLGLVTSEVKANAKYFKVNSESPFFPELQSLVLKTVGIARVINTSLKGFKGLIFAFIYGSFATKEAGIKSDIDLFLISKATIDSLILAKAIKAAEIEIGREIQYSLFDMKEFLKKWKKGDDFINNVVRSPKIMILGDENGFKRFTK